MDDNTQTPQQNYPPGSNSPYDNTQTSPDQTPSDADKRTRNYIYIITAIMLILIAALVGVIFAARNNSNNNATVTPTPLPSSTVLAPTITTVPSMTMTLTPTPSATTSATPTVSTTSINIQNYTFSPAIDHISSGEKITWTNLDNVTHTVTFADGTSSGNLSNGQTYARRFTSAGTYTYICSIHPFMKGSVIVK